MELRHLRSFIAIVEEKGFSAAGRKLHIAQPALTRQIKDLESELGFAVLWRTKREVKATPGGQVLYEQAKRLVGQSTETMMSAQRAARGEAGRLSIGFFGTATASFLPSLVNEFHRKYPAVRIDLAEMNPAEQMDALRQGRIDLAFNRPVPPAELHDLAQEVVYRDKLVVALPTNHRLCERKVIALSELALEPFVLLSRDQAPRLIDQLISFCNRAGFSPEVRIESRLMSTVLIFVACGLGVSVVPSCVRHLGQVGVVFRPSKPLSPAVNLVALWNKKLPSPTVAAFLGVIRKSLPKIQQTMSPI